MTLAHLHPAGRTLTWPLNVGHFYCVNATLVSMVQVSVREAADRLGLSPQRVRHLIAQGDLPALRVGGHWVVAEADLRQVRRVSRPMSARIAWALAALLDGEPVHGLAPREVSRLRERARQLEADRDGRTALVNSWMARRATVHRSSAAAADLADLRADPRFHASGVSDPRAQLSAAAEVEGYVAPTHLKAVADDFLLVTRPTGVAAGANVILREHDVGGRTVPALAVAADLLERSGARESAAAQRILDGLVGLRAWER